MSGLHANQYGLHLISFSGRSNNRHIGDKSAPLAGDDDATRQQVAESEQKRREVKRRGNLIELPEEINAIGMQCSWRSGRLHCVAPARGWPLPAHLKQVVVVAVAVVSLGSPFESSRQLSAPIAPKITRKGHLLSLKALQAARRESQAKPSQATRRLAG